MTLKRQIKYHNELLKKIANFYGFNSIEYIKIEKLCNEIQREMQREINESITK